MKDAASPYQLDKRLIKEAFNRAAPHYDANAVLQHEVADRMLARLDYVRLAPELIIDVGAGTGRCARGLVQRYRKARVVALDLAQAMLVRSRRELNWLSRWRPRQLFVCGDAEHLPLRDRCAQLLFSNLTLQWCPDLDQTFHEFHRVLQPGGLLMFSSFGPDTLKELRQSWRAVDDDVHVNAFMDMHDLGDALLRAGFTDPVMDVEHITLTYKDALQLMREIKAIGAHNVTAGRLHGLTGRQKLQKLMTAYEQFRRDGVLPCTYEVVYGHAWVPEKSKITSHPGGEAHVPVTSIQRSRRRA